MADEVSIWGPAAAETSFFTGSGAPLPALGEDGDFYLDLDVHDLYGPKTLGDWGTPVSLIGPVGPTGDTGATGPQGIQGIPGPKGTKGDTGLTGATGAAGPAGADGTDGADGSQIFADVIDPVAIDGEVGDYWLNKTTSTLWGPKDAINDWVGTSLVLKGDTGDTGAAGADGADAPILDLHVGQQNITNNATGIVVAAAADPTLHSPADFIQVAGVFDAVPHGYNNGVTQQTNQLTVGRTGVYKIALWASYSNSANNATVGFRFAVNGVISLSRTPKNKTTTAADYKILSAHGIHPFAEGDVITLWIASDVGTTVTITDAVFSLQECIATGYDLSVEDEGILVATTPTSLDFVGAGVTVTDTGGGALQVTIPGGGGGGGSLDVEEEGVSVDAAVAVMDFVGAGVTVTQTAAGEVEVNIPGELFSGTVESVNSGTGITVDNTDPDNPTVGWDGVNVSDEGTPVVTAREIDFAGAGVTVTDVAGVATVTIPGGGGSGSGWLSGIPSGTEVVFPFEWESSAFGGTATNTAAIARFAVVRLDSDITIDAFKLEITTSPGASTVDVALYEFLGNGLVGDVVAVATLSSSSTGVKTGVISPAVAVPAGTYFRLIANSGSNTTYRGIAAGSTHQGGLVESSMVVSDVWAVLSGTAEFDERFMDQTSLPGGSYSTGMDLTGLNLTTSNTVGLANNAITTLVID